MTKDANLKKVARRHALETGQRYTEARADLEGLRAGSAGDVGPTTVAPWRCMSRSLNVSSHTFAIAVGLNLSR